MVRLPAADVKPFTFTHIFVLAIYLHIYLYLHAFIFVSSFLSSFLVFLLHFSHTYLYSIPSPIAGHLVEIRSDHVPNGSVRGDELPGRLSHRHRLLRLPPQNRLYLWYLHSHSPLPFCAIFHRIIRETSQKQQQEGGEEG